jgi:hypothetical protein
MPLTLRVSSSKPPGEKSSKEVLARLIPMAMGSPWLTLKQQKRFYMQVSAQAHPMRVQTRAYSTQHQHLSKLA